MQLKARKPQATKSQRVTRRRRLQKQRGGAVFSALTDLAHTEELWKPHLERLGITTLLTDRTQAPTSEGEKKQRMDDFIRIMMKQDDLFQAALEIEKGAVGVQGASISDFVDKVDVIKKEQPLSYIKEVEKAIAFEYSDSDDSKWYKLRRQPFMGLVFYPWKASNILVRSLADYLQVFQKENTYKLLDNPKFTGSRELIELQGSHLEAYVRSQAWYLTDQNLADGFFTSQNLTAFTEGTNMPFFKGVIQKIVEFKDTPIAELFGTDACKGFFFKEGNIDSADVYADATARLYHLYRKTLQSNAAWSSSQLLTAFGENCPISTDDAFQTEFKTNKTYLPDELYWDTLLLDTNVTFRSLIAQISPLLLNYLLRLSYALENPTAGHPLVKEKPSSLESAAPAGT